MAQMVQNNFLISVSKLFRNNQEQKELLNEEQIQQLETILKEIVGDDSVLVEIDEVNE